MQCHQLQDQADKSSLPGLLNPEEKGTAIHML
jgi:hypothetical protein